MPRKLSAITEYLMKEANEQGMTVREAASHARVDQKTILKYWKKSGLKPRGRLVKIRLKDIVKIPLKPGEHVTIEGLITRIKEEHDLKNSVDAKDLEAKLDLLVQCRVYSFNEKEKAYYLPETA